MQTDSRFRRPRFHQRINHYCNISPQLPTFWLANMLVLVSMTPLAS
uniref:Uncharacterized protein n=1 Tax=Anguilla anguilla TaxID=7936 RepID=A0A0E9VHJ7_ANGAN